jgi:hypothetical protein
MPWIHDTFDIMHRASMSHELVLAIERPILHPSRRAERRYSTRIVLALGVPPLRPTTFPQHSRRTWNRLDHDMGRDEYDRLATRVPTL